MGRFGTLLFIIFAVFAVACAIVLLTPKAHADTRPSEVAAALPVRAVNPLATSLSAGYADWLWAGVRLNLQ